MGGFCAGNETINYLWATNPKGPYTGSDTTCRVALFPPFMLEFDDLVIRLNNQLYFSSMANVTFYQFLQRSSKIKSKWSLRYFKFTFIKLSGICQDLLYRRARALADYENSNKALDKARLKSKDIPQAEEHQQQCLQKFDKLSESGKKGLSVCT